MNRRTASLLFILVLGGLAHSIHCVRAATITLVGVDEETNDAWRTTDVAKPFFDADNIYGTDGYYIAQFPEGDPTNVSQPIYGIVTVSGAYEGVGAETFQSTFDDVTLTGPGPVPDRVAGDYWVDNAGPTGTEHALITLTLSQAASFRLGVITDQTPDTAPQGPGLIWEASRAVRITGPDGIDTGVVDAAGPGEAWRDADVDYVLFDIAGAAGDVFTIWGVQDERWVANALGGVFFDPSAAIDFRITGLALTNPGQPNGSAEITFNSLPGRAYKLQFSTDLSSWLDSKHDNVVATSDTTMLIETLAATNFSRVFYRVVEL